MNEYRSFFEQALEFAPNGLLFLDTSGRIQSVNRAVESLFGWSREELLGRPVETLLPTRYRAQHEGHRAAFHTNGYIQAANGRDLWGLRKDGIEIPVQVYVNRIQNESGQITLCTITDIAERVRYEQQLEEAKRTAEAANRAKSDFLARMSHEIRTPMNLIMGMNALLLESELDEKQHEYVEISYRNVRRLLRLINGILDLSKVEAGKVTLDAKPFDVRTVVEECAATIAASVEKKGLHLRLALGADVWPYWVGDAERLQQVLLNLIGNAVKFTEQGEIEVGLRPAIDGNGRSGLRFEVTDTGCGVPSGKAAEIFEAFQQADGSMNRSYEGTGLGLAIARSLVELMGGAIWLEPRSSPGSRFVFTAFLPRATSYQVRSRPASPKSVRLKLERARILVVDDNEENAILVRAYLESLPLELDFAHNGAEAVAKRQATPYDLILMDVQMPVMDGYTATRTIRAWEAEVEAARVPVVALTAHALNEARAEAIRAGCDGYLAKPVERHELLQAIQQFALHPPAGTPPPASIETRRPEYLRNRRLDLDKLRAALAAGDFEGIRVIGHNSKGTGAGYGFPAISTAGAALEQAARAADLAAVTDSVAEFERCVNSAS